MSWVSEIVRAAGLSNQAFYRHFRSKDELLVAVLDKGIRLLGSYLRHRMETAATPEQKIRRWLAGMLRRQPPLPMEVTSHDLAPVLKISRNSAARAVSPPRTSSASSIPTSRPSSAAAASGWRRPTRS